jgi:hypothetical protein
MFFGRGFCPTRRRKEGREGGREEDFGFWIGDWGLGIGDWGLGIGDFGLRIGELPAARGEPVMWAEGKGRGRGARAIFASGGPRVGAALDVQESKRTRNGPILCGMPSSSSACPACFTCPRGRGHGARSIGNLNNNKSREERAARRERSTRRRAPRSSATAGSALCVGQQLGNTNVPP